ncbi:hypothetical protein [uncultured Marinobacter sp.]|uniref:hypothetical protein n=1 Tax=uncultured Marinobacter sp. TaxID=187379 RepID=UPI00258DE9CB|nr:hypothetical protein [uncultured Marinobacter sp.]
MSGDGGDNTIKDTPEQKYLAQVAAEKWNFAQDKLAPLENRYMEQVEQMDSEANRSYIRGRTMQAQNQALSKTQQQMGLSMGKAGINPNSGRFMGETDNLGLDLAEAGGENLGRAQFEQDTQQIRGLQNITAIGQGQSGQAQAGLSRMAQESAADAIGDAQNAFNRRSANLQLVGTVAGAGTRYGMENGWFESGANE